MRPNGHGKLRQPPVEAVTRNVEGLTESIFAGGKSQLERDLPSRRKLQVVKFPIACTLQPSDARSQLGEWHDGASSSPWSPL